MKLKKLIISNIPFAFVIYPVGKLAEAFRLSPGTDFSGKLCFECGSIGSL